MSPNVINRNFHFSVLSVFFLIGLVGILHHEIWLDEAHHWLIAKDSHSLVELYYNMRYDGHPILWNILLFFVTYVTSNTFYMQLLNLMIASAAVFIFLSHAPFSKFHKILFVFGYYILYEYTVISRNYSLILLLGFICAALYSRRRKDYFRLCIAIAILANTHLFGLIISVCLALILMLDWIFYQPKSAVAKYLLGLMIIGVGIILSVLQIIPPEDTKLVHNFGLPALSDTGRLISFFLKGFVPIPDVTKYNFWNTSLIANYARPLGGLLSLILLFIPLFLLRRRILAITFFYSCTFLFMVFFSATGMAASRYFGIIYIVFIISYWLAQHEEASNRLKIFMIGEPLYVSISSRMITCLFAVHVLISIPFYYFDLNHPFSEAKATVNYLRKERLNDEFIVVDNCLCTTLSAYLNKQIYYLSFNSLGSYCPWNNGVSDDDRGIIDKLKLIVNKRHSDFIFVRSKKLVLPPKEHDIIFLKSFTQGMVESENYYIYRITY